MHNPLVETPELLPQEFVPHALPAEEVAKQLRTGEQGLSVQEAQQRLQQYGYNELEAIKPISISELILHQFKSPLIYILLAAAVVTLLLGEYIDTGVIAAVLISASLMKSFLNFLGASRTRPYGATVRRVCHTP